MKKLQKSLEDMGEAFCKILQAELQENFEDLEIILMLISCFDRWRKKLEEKLRLASGYSNEDEVFDCIKNGLKHF